MPFPKARSSETAPMLCEAETAMAHSSSSPWSTQPRWLERDLPQQGSTPFLLFSSSPPETEDANSDGHSHRWLIWSLFLPLPWIRCFLLSTHVQDALPQPPFFRLVKAQCATWQQAHCFRSGSRMCPEKAQLYFVMWNKETGIETSLSFGWRCHDVLMHS